MGACWVHVRYLFGPQDSAVLSLLAISKIGVCFLGNKKFAHGSVGDVHC